LPRDHGHVVAIADPPVRLAARYQCTFEFINSTNRRPTWAAVCSAMGFQLVPMPQILAGVAPPDGANAPGLRNEPAIANGRLYVGTGGGHVYALCPNRRSFDADVRNKMSRVVAAIVFAMLLAVPDLHLAERGMRRWEQAHDSPKRYDWPRRRAPPCPCASSSRNGM